MLAPSFTILAPPLNNAIDRTGELQALVAADPARMRILQLVRALALLDCWVGAGFVRSLVWDHLHGRASALQADIDVVWYDPGAPTAQRDAALEAQLRDADATLAWSVKNQARMHRRNDDRAYHSATDAMRYWPETATAVALRLEQDGSIAVAAPFGLDDLFGLVLRPTPRFIGAKYPIYLERVRAKGWHRRWPGVTLCPGELGAALTAPSADRD